MKHVGYWWNDSNIELIEQGGRVFALYGWNGEAFTNCWECFGEYHDISSKEMYVAQPVRRFELEDIQLDEIEENSPEWDYAVEIVDYNIYK